MSSSSKWGAFWLIVIGAIVGIGLSCGLVSAVHWAGSTEFCGSFCHSMSPVKLAWQQGSHYKTSVGYEVGCSDCHLLNESTRPLGPIGYGELLVAKVKAASISGWGHVSGSINTPEKWLAHRDELSKAVINTMTKNGFNNCRGCHNLSMMNNPKKPFVAKMHEGMINKPESNCIMCHKTAGHNYKDVDAYVKAENKWPTMEAFQEFMKKSAAAAPAPAK